MKRKLNCYDSSTSLKVNSLELPWRFKARISKCIDKVRKSKLLRKLLASLKGLNATVQQIGKLE